MVGIEHRDPKGADVCPALYPTPTKGDGRVRPNNLRTGGRQPGVAESPRRKVPCQQCGFLCDLSRQAPSGGDLSGNGAFAGSSIESTDYGYVADSVIAAGAGCPNCGSKNFAPSRAGHMNQEA